MTGRRGEVELFVAFDDPNSALALVELDRRLAGRRVDLSVRPVLHRDMEGDPAVEAKRAYAVVDAGRLAERYGLELSRSAPVAAAETAFLGEWVAAAGSRGRDFAVSAAKEVWFESAAGAAVDREGLARTFSLAVGGVPASDGSARVRANEKLMKRRGAYAVPMAFVHGRLFFAHERLDQICDELDLLGWKVR